MTVPVEYAVPIMVIANLFIGTAYMIAAMTVMPQFKGMSRASQLSGILFLMTCGIFNHYEPILHLGADVEAVPILSLHMIIGHVVQAISAVSFVGFVSRDVARGRDPFVIGERRLARRRVENERRRT